MRNVACGHFSPTDFFVGKPTNVGRSTNEKKEKSVSLSTTLYRDCLCVSRIDKRLSSQIVATWVGLSLWLSCHFITYTLTFFPRSHYRFSSFLLSYVGIVFLFWRWVKDSAFFCHRALLIQGQCNRKAKQKKLNRLRCFSHFEDCAAVFIISRLLTNPCLL
jgi:hypothetical protein